MDAFPSNHPSPENLRAYSLGRLDDASALAVGRHIEQCRECQRLAAEMAPDTFLGRLRDVQAGPVMSESSAGIPVEAQSELGRSNVAQLRPPETRLRPVLPLILNQPSVPRRILPARSPKQR